MKKREEEIRRPQPPPPKKKPNILINGKIQSPKMSSFLTPSLRQTKKMCLLDKVPILIMGEIYNLFEVIH